MKFNYKILLIIALLCLAPAKQSFAIDLRGSTFSHDPATLIKDGDNYWHFFTAPGIGAAFSRDMITWTGTNNHIFQPGAGWKNNYPAWTIPYFGSGENANTNGNLWAPDVIHMNGAYYMYYSCSSFGSSNSAIGVAKSASLNNPNWEDLGMVVNSSSWSDVNAIDPGMFKDDDGKVYMVYGSFSGGIGIVEIDSITGKATTPVKVLAGGNGQSYEAPAMFKQDGYYYLVINRGSCCNGLESTYYIVVSRSTNVNGPYRNYRTLLPNKDGKYIGPGHFSLYRDTCADYVTAHYYDGNANGFARYDLLRMRMVDGWPELYRDFSINTCDKTFEDRYPKIVSASAEEGGNAASKILDGNNSDGSTWSAEGFPQNTVIDYGENKSIIGVRLWTFFNRAYQYTVEFSEDSDFTNSFIVDRSENSSKTQPITNDFDAITARYARLTVTGISGSSSTSLGITEFEIVESPTGFPAVNDEENKSFVIYPNPAEKEVNIQISDASLYNANLAIYNQLGQLVHSNSVINTTETIDVSSLQKGVYMLVLINQNQRITQRFIIN